MDEVKCEIRNVEKKYGNVKVLEDISFKLCNGKVYGLIGENGAGKSTLMKILAGLVSQDAGDVIFRGQGVVGALIEEVGAYNHLNIEDNLKIFADYIKYYDKQKIQDLISVVGLSSDKKKKVKNYSVGMKKRLGIAIALLNRPNVLLLDEPSCGLDIEGIIATRNIVKEYMKQEGVVTLISSHDTRDLVELCDVIIFMHKGRIIACEEGFERDSIKLEKMYLEYLRGADDEISKK